MARLQTASAALVCAAIITAQPAKRNITLHDLPATLRPLFPTFDAPRTAIERSRAARLQGGEKAPLIFSLLQSGRFPRELRIGPAVGARAFQETGYIPAGVIRRTSDFLSAPAGQ